MTAEDLLRRLAETLDAHAWDDLPGLLHEEFTCTLVHTGEVFDRDAWVSFNAGYPGFEHITMEESVGTAERAAGRGHVTGLDEHGVPALRRRHVRHRTGRTARFRHGDLDRHRRGTTTRDALTWSGSSGSRSARVTAHESR